MQSLSHCCSRSRVFGYIIRSPAPQIRRTLALWRTLLSHCGCQSWLYRCEIGLHALPNRLYESEIGLRGPQCEIGLHALPTRLYESEIGLRGPQCKIGLHAFPTPLYESEIGLRGPQCEIGLRPLPTRLYESEIGLRGPQIRRTVAPWQTILSRRMRERSGKRNRRGPRGREEAIVSWAAEAFGFLHRRERAMLREIWRHPCKMTGCCWWYYTVVVVEACNMTGCC